jgi:CHAT domain-containing protein
MGNYEKALEHFQKILKIYEQLSSRSGAAWLRNQIADVYAAQGKNESALTYYDLSLKAHEELGNKPMQAHSLYGIGRIRFTEGKFAEAATLFERAAILARAGNSPEIRWKILNLLGQTRRALHENDQARKDFVEAIAVIEQLRSQLAGSERDRELSFESKTTPYLEMVELLIEANDLTGAFVYAERAKGRMLLDVLRHGRADITSSMTADEGDKERILKASMTAVSSQIRREIALPQPDQAKLAGLEERLQRARLEYEAYETRIHAAHPELIIQRGESQPLTISEAGSLIPDQETALLEYVVAPEKTYLFVLTRTSISEPVAATVFAGNLRLKVFSIPITSRELTTRVTQFRQTLAGNSLGFKEPSRQLYDLLLRPAAKELEGKTIVGIVPSGQLWELPFQALLTQQDRYVLQDHALFYAPSLSVLREMRKKNARHEIAKRTTDVPNASLVKVNAAASAPPPALLAMGNPSLSASLVSRTQSDDRSLSLGDLPDAEREVKDLGEIYGAQRSKILIGTAAREETVKAEAARYPILHFATHGLLDDENPLYSRLLLASSNGNDDGFLEAREIMKLDLHADLAVLSACQTARGTIGPGEGLIGMSWAFFIAGASTTVVSQWKVDSASTSRLMVDFHRSLQGADKPPPVSKAEALRRAALKLMSVPKYRHPFYWSGFVVVGSGI